MARKPDPAIQEKQRRALNLRKAGASYDTISDQLGYAGRGAAYKAVQAALRDLARDTSEELHLLDGERLDQMLLALWPKAMKADGWAIDRILKITELRARPKPAETVGRVAAGVERDLARLPESARSSALAETARTLARNVDSGSSPAQCARELRAVMADLTTQHATAAPVDPGKGVKVSDITARIAARRDAATG